MNYRKSLARRPSLHFKGKLSGAVIAALSATTLLFPCLAAFAAPPGVLLRGAEAVSALGGRLAAVASDAGISPEALRVALLSDSTIGVQISAGSGSPRVVFTDAAIPKLSVDLASAPTVSGDEFKLHSKPNARRVLYLDFNGHTEGPATIFADPNGWSALAAANGLKAKGFDSDGDPRSFSQGERDLISEVWRRVSALLAQSDIDVTTEEPSHDALTRITAGDQTSGLRVVVGSDAGKALCGDTCSGAVYLNSFGRLSPFEEVAWVTKIGSAAEIADSVMHLVGHALGLIHGDAAKPSSTATPAPSSTEKLGFAKGREKLDAARGAGRAFQDAVTQYRGRPQPNALPALQGLADKRRTAIVQALESGISPSEVATLFYTDAQKAELPPQVRDRVEKVVQVTGRYQRGEVDLFNEGSSKPIHAVRTNGGGWMRAHLRDGVGIKPGATIQIRGTQIDNNVIVDSADEVAASTFTAAATTSGTTSGATVAAIGNPLTLHSLPGATKVIYLDFDGFVTQNTVWNSYSFNGTGATNPSIVSPAYDTNGDPTTFSSSELADIQDAWKRIAEDYAPFNVDVTTEDPGVEALRKTSSTDTNWGIRMVITRDTEGSGAGGIAYIGSFNWDSDTPGFVYTTGGKNIAEAASHEAGHSLGLSHDGTSTTGYYTGHGSGETGWAPLMGVGYYQNVTTWDNGTYLDSNNGGTSANYGAGPDDIKVIATSNGFGFRSDDVSNTTAGATALTVTNGSVSTRGLIETAADVDVFTFSTDGGAVAFNVSPANPGPNLDILAELLDSSGNTILSINPVDQVGAAISSNLSAGQYYLRVLGIGRPSPGYSDYGSLGQYTITGTLTTSTTADTTPPAISAVGSSGITATAAVISWSTNEASDTQVEYGTTSNFGSSTALNATLSTSHSASLSGLLASTTYYYRVKSRDSAGNLGVSAAGTFITAQAPISNEMKVSSLKFSSNRKKGTVTVSGTVLATSTATGISGVVVSGTFGGVLTGSGSATTNSTGTFTLTTTYKSGTGTFTVGSVTKSGMSLSASGNVLTASVTLR